jgi:hypothetical protein
MDAINKKIDYAQEVQSTLRALLTEVRYLMRIELIIGFRTQDGNYHYPTYRC